MPVAVSDGCSKFQFEHVTSPAVLTEGDIAVGQFGDIEDGDVIWCVEHDAHLAAGFFASVFEQDDVEWCAADAVAVIINVNDAIRILGCRI